MASAREKYQTLIELAPDAIFLVDPAGVITEVNEKAAALVEYDRNDLEGMDLIAVHPATDSDQYRALFERTIETGQIRAERLPNGEPLYLETKSGAKVPVELHAWTIAADGETWVYAIARDITERYERERELERKRERLEQFASIVAHDLRNPLNVADLRLDLLQQEYDDENLDQVEDALARMDTLIENTLLLAEQGQTITEREHVVLDELLENCWEMVETDAATLARESVAGTTVYADPDRLRQVFENLFRNSVEHGSTGSRPEADDAVEHGVSDGALTVRITTGESTLVVEDDGPGIPPDRREGVFEPGETESDVGTGFGLAIVERICEAHGWEISVTESDLGGARFEITDIEFE
jgi:PAS domain S-box-containing protein